MSRSKTTNIAYLGRDQSDVNRHQEMAYIKISRIAGEELGVDSEVDSSPHRGNSSSDPG